jgi:RimJ/RimL family protein N-acetyltransferase
VGERVQWMAPPPPGREPLWGETVTLVPVDPATHGDALFEAAEGEGADPHLWRYMAVGPFGDRAAFRAWLETAAASDDSLFFTVVDRVTGRPAGMASYLRTTPAMGTIEIGNIWFGTPLQRTRGGTEAIYLLARRVFDDLGYRRLEWKCDAFNARSRRAADRFGFAFEGIFRQHMVIKGRNRDTAWYALVDIDWPAVRGSFERWLDPANFDGHGRQRRSLAELRTGA